MKVILVACMVMPGYHYCMPLETLVALNYHNSFILTVGITGVDSHARDMYGNSHSQGACILFEVPSIHKVAGTICSESMYM